MSGAVRAKATGILRRRAEWFARREAARRLTTAGFSIISDDCWGGELYRLTGRQFLTPFVGLFVVADCYLRILGDLDRALRSNLVEVATSRHRQTDAERNTKWYPLGLLTEVDAELHFMHYPSFHEAREKWLRRRERVLMDNLFVKFGPPHDGTAAKLVGEFAQLSYEQKLVVDDRPFRSVPTAGGPYFPDSVVQLHAGAPSFDYVDWLNGGSGAVTMTSRVRRTLMYGGWS